LGPDSVQLADVYNSIGVLSEYTNNNSKALECFGKAIDINERHYGPNSLTVALYRFNRAMVEEDQEHHEAALADVSPAAATYRAQLGPLHPTTLLMTSRVARLQAEVGRTEDAAATVHALLQSLHGQDVAPVAQAPVLEVAGEVQLSTNHPAEALATFQEYARTEVAYQGAMTNNVMRAYMSIAVCHIMLHQDSDALAAEAQAQTAADGFMRQLLVCSNAQQRMACMRKMPLYNEYATLGAAGPLAQVVLRRKGLVLDSLVEDRLTALASHDPQVRSLFARLQTRSVELVQTSLNPRPDVPPATITATIDKLQNEVNDLQGQLSMRVSGLGRSLRALDTTTAQVQAVLPADSAYIDIIRYQKLEPDEKMGIVGVPSFGAIILTPHGDPTWIPLGPAKDIESAVSQYQLAAKSGAGADPALLQYLYKLVLAPIHKRIPASAHTWIISPDTVLNFVSFAALLQPDGTFIGEHHVIRYVASGRDLLHAAPVVKNQAMVLVGNPDFGAAHVEHPIAPPLPGTAREIDELSSMAKDWGWTPQTVTGKAATRQRVLALQSPYVLHIATHGFFLDAPADEPSDSIPGAPSRNLFVGPAQSMPRYEKNPMYASGLALAGAEATLEAWNSGGTPDTGQDGVLTAAEVGAMPLQGTWLAVLSACDTAQGRPEAGQGVMGLRRGFVQAGVANLVMTLWSISDQETASFMQDFYRAAHSTHNPGLALGQTQGRWLTRLRLSRGPQAAAQAVGCFVVSTQGHP
jgi:CHAT domain-containing protein